MVPAVGVLRVNFLAVWEYFSALVGSGGTTMVRPIKSKIEINPGGILIILTVWYQQAR